MAPGGGEGRDGDISHLTSRGDTGEGGWGGTIVPAAPPPAWLEGRGLGRAKPETTGPCSPDHGKVASSLARLTSWPPHLDRSPHFPS